MQHPLEGRLPTRGWLHRRVRPYAVAIGSVGGWLVVVWLAPQLALGNALLLALAAVTSSAWYGGVGPGLMAAMLTLLSADYLLPILRGTWNPSGDAMRPSLFASVAVLVSALSQAKKHAEDDLERSLQTLERRVHERTEELTVANTALNAQIVERRQAEEAYRELFENAQDGVFTLALDGSLTSLNKAGERFIGHTRDHLVGRRIEELVAATDRSRVAAACSTVRSEGQAAPFVVELTNAAGQPTKVEVQLRAITREGQAAGMHGVARDLTERERLEAELRQAHKLEAIGHLAGGVAHDFNNLLMVIQGYSEMLLTQVQEDATRRDLREIHEAARRGSDLTRQLLAFGRKQVLRVTPLDLNQVVVDTSQMLTRLIGENITLRIQPHEEFCAIEADQGQLEQVLMNLAVNARDAMSRGGTLTLTVGRQRLSARLHALPAGDYVTLAVRDTGCGMDEAILDRAFEPFFTTKAPGKGSGLGLSTVYGVVKQLGGDIAVESTPLQGTVFTVYLPATHKLPETCGDLSQAGLAEGSHETVLLVEDEAPVRHLLSSVLKRHGYRVIECSSPREALTTAARHDGPLDLVLTDVIMPEMSGPEMVALLKNVRPEPAVLYVSGYATDALVTDRVLPHAVALVHKPVSARQLLEAVRRALTTDPALQRAS
jgi:two-component system cell cycle sensor histidine kinase/response regulator CckA